MDSERTAESARGGASGRAWEGAAQAVLLLALAGLLLSGIVVCPSRAVLGIPCPGCGLTRATLAALRGDIAESFAMHPLWPLVVPVAAWAVSRPALVRAGVVAADGLDPLRRVSVRGWMGLAALLVGVWALRLAGHLGGHPDGLHPELGLAARALGALRGALGV